MLPKIFPLNLADKFSEAFMDRSKRMNKLSVLDMSSENTEEGEEASKAKDTPPFGN